MTELQLGQKVRYKNTIYKYYDREYNQTEDEWGFVTTNRVKRTWHRHAHLEHVYAAMARPEYKGHLADLAGEGIVTGIRTFTEGVVIPYMGEQSEYKPTKTFKVYIVTHHIRRKPVYVLPEDIEVIE